METIKVENVKEAIDALHISREYAKNNNTWTPDFIIGQVKAYDFCIGVLEDLIVRRQRNEPRQSDRTRKRA